MTQLAEPPTTRTPGRALAIAAIHAYAQWLADHPEVPLPDHLDGANFQLGVDRDASIAVVRAFADRFDAAKHTSGNSGWAVLRLMDEPIQINHTVFVGHEPAKTSEEWL